MLAVLAAVSEDVANGAARGRIAPILRRKKSRRKCSVPRGINENNAART